jgi:hypothetical protein
MALTGRYQGIIPSTVLLTENSWYSLEITAVKDGVGTLVSKEKMQAVIHSRQYENSENLEINYLFIGSDNLITYNYLTNNQTGEYIEDATVSMTLKTEAGVAVSGAVDIEMVHQE